MNPSAQYGVNVADWSPEYYVWGGAGVNETVTSVRRTAGWHEFKLQVTATGFNALIDGIIVGSVNGDFYFDEVRLNLSGPVWRPQRNILLRRLPLSAASVIIQVGRRRRNGAGPLESRERKRDRRIVLSGEPEGPSETVIRPLQLRSKAAGVD